MNARQLAYDTAKNRVSQVTDSAGGGTQAWTYDARGNVTDNGPNAFTYDTANQPTSITATGLSEAHTYDGNLKRVKTVRNGETTYWVYSVLTGTPLVQDEVTAGDITHYLSGGGLTLRLLNGTAHRYTHLDHQGTPLAQTWYTGLLAWREHYTPYGEKTMRHASNDNDIGYTGHVQDDLSGLTYMQARYYDPVAARFLSTDPIGYQDQFNLYAYVGNDPVNMTDPTGMCSEENSGSGILCGFEDWLTSKIEPMVEGAMESAGVDVVPEGQRDPNGVYGHEADPNTPIEEASAIAGRVAEAGAERMNPLGAIKPIKKAIDDIPASTPVGRRGSPMDVTPGTNAPGSVGGRDYSGHAFDQMQGRGIPPSAVENAIGTGARSAGRTPGTSVFRDGTNGVSVVVDDASGRVVTVITTGRQ